MRSSLLAVALVLSSCSRCGSAAAVVDAGALTRRSVELRTALLYSYPEYRDTAVLEVTGKVTRVIPGLTPAQRDEALGSLKWATAEDGGWQLNTLHLSQPAPDALAVQISYDADQLSHLYVSANGLTSAELSMYLPRTLPIGSERFTFFVHYTSSPVRSRQLVKQAVGLLLGNSLWRVEGSAPDWTDAGAEAVPEAETVVVRSTDDARITFHRTGGQVRVEYAAQTVTWR